MPDPQPDPTKFAALGFVTWPQARQAIQTTVAAVAAYTVATYFELPQGYWSVMTAILVVQASVGASLGLAIDRLLATVFGGAVGGLLVALFGEARLPLLGVSVLSLSYVATLRSSLRLAPVTAAIVILSDPHYGGAVSSAVNRVIEIGLGAVIAIITSLLVFPSRAGTALAEHVSRMLPLLAEHLDGTIRAAQGKPRSLEELLALNGKVRAALAIGETLATEARRELAGHVAAHADPAAVLRTLRRTWYTLMMAARSVQSGLPPVGIDPLRANLDQIRDAGPAVIRQLGDTYAGKAPQVDLVQLQSVLSGFETAVVEVRRSGVLRELSTDDTARFFTFAFAMGQLPQNLADLRDRYDDLATKMIPMTSSE